MPLVSFSTTEIKRYPRLRKALEAELKIRGSDKSPKEELREHLPAAVWEAWHLHEWEDPKELVGRLACSLPLLQHGPGAP